MRIRKRRYYWKGRRCSKGEHKISKILTEHNIEFECEKTFDTCRSPKNHRLRFDFFLPTYNILIEFQGHHHFRPVNKYRRAKIVHEKTKVHDKIKREYVQQNNLVLFEIHYKDYENLEEIIMNFLGDSI